MKQNEENIQIISCPICEKKDLALHMKTRDFFFTKEEFTLSKCVNCSFVFTNPIPKNLARYYETEEYLSHNTESGGIISKIYSYIRTINIKRKYNLVSKYSKNGDILDIGCGTGELLSFFKKQGWQTTGIEPNKNARDLAIEHIAQNVFNEGKLDELSDGSFDVVSMWHVLEHVQGLNNRIQQVAKLAKDDGIMIFALPNLNSPDAVKYGSYWSGLDVPRHLYHFTQNSFEKLIEKHGLKLIHAEPMKFDAYYVSLLSEKYLSKKLYLLSALYNGFRSNLLAKRNNNYSSMIFVCNKVL